MKPHQNRVIIEKAELDIKLVALIDFVNNSPLYGTLPEDEQNRLGRQIEVMYEYSRILGHRIEAFPA